METITTEVLVVGAGAAGIRAALAASEAGAEVLLVVKGELTRTGSTFSAVSKGWGIQALLEEERTVESLEAFFDDIIRVGRGTCDPKLVQILVEESGPRVQDLISYGMRFRKDSAGNYLRTKGCFSDYERAFVTEDYENIQESFLSGLRRFPVKIIMAYVVELIRAEGACWGAWVISESGEGLMICAPATILATGGGAGVFRDHLASEHEIGDGYSLAFKAGAELNNMEFIQFMLGLKNGHSRKFLPLSDLRKPKMLVDHQGFDLLKKHIQHPATRMQAVEDRQQHCPFSCFDGSYKVDIAVARERLEGKEVLWGGGNGVNGKLEVAHFAHAFNGGVKIDVHSETTVPGLYACGEVAAGPHGADRIGGCMMTATQVFGYRAGKSAAKRAKSMRSVNLPEIKQSNWVMYPVKKDGNDSHGVSEVVRSVKDAMAKYTMVLRNEKGLERCKNRLNDCNVRLEEMRGTNTLSPRRYFEVRNMILTAKLITRSAFMRKESRGAHYREDFPVTTDIPLLF